MSRKFIFYISFFVILFVAGGCKAGKKAGGSKLKSRNANYVLKKMEKAAFEADWFEGKAKVNITYLGQKLPGVTMNIKVQKDQIIWANMKKLGIELGRLKITQDSIFVLDRFNKNYLAKGIGELTAMYGIPADFGTIQDVLFGNAFFWGKGNLETRVAKENYQIVGESGRQNSTHLVDGFNYFLQTQYLLDQEQNWELDASYEGYNQPEHPNFSYIRKIKVTQPEPITLTLSFSKIEINQPTTYKFSIPAHYKPLQLD